jgi:hypothetical protein
MTDDLESKLRDALRPTAPREDFERRLMARITATQRDPVKRRGAFIRTPATWWFSAAMAATVILAVGVQEHRVDQENREKGLEARRQVMQALRVTNDKLDLAYRAVRDQSGALGGDPGA